MQFPSAQSLQTSCMGPPAPKNGAIRMTKRNGMQQFINRSNVYRAGEGISGARDDGFVSGRCFTGRGKVCRPTTTTGAKSPY